MGNKILLVEDDDFIRDSLVKLLEQEQYIVSACGSLNEARSVVITYIPDLVILDVLLPDGTGFDFCKELKQSMPVPVLFLTCCDEDEDIIRGLDNGGDDYIAKPFRSKILFARIRALLRRTTSDNNIIKIGSFLFDNNKRFFAIDGVPTGLTPIEFMILFELAKSHDTVVTRDVLLHTIWQMGCDYLDDNILSVHISRLRNKLGKYSDRLITERGAGYMLRCNDE